MSYRCIFPCRSSFPSELNLVQHYKKKRGCRERWETRQQELEQIIFERAAALRRARVREAAEKAEKDQGEDNLAQNNDLDFAFDHGFEANGDQESVGEHSVDTSLGATPPPSDHLPEVQVDDPPDSSGDEDDLDDLAAVLDTPFDVAANFDDFIFGVPVEDGADNDFDPYAEPANDSDAEENLLPNGLTTHDLGGDYPLDDSRTQDMEELQEPALSAEPGPELNTDVDPGEIETYPCAGEIKKKAGTHFDRLLKKQMGDAVNPYTPFFGLAEFELVTWLNELPLSKVDSFLQLSWVTSLPYLVCLHYLIVDTQVKTKGGTSFGSGKSMRERIDRLPKPRMIWKNVEVQPPSGTTSSPVVLCYRDPVEAIRTLLDRPSLRSHLTYTPERHWTDKNAGLRQYTEVMTGDWAWETQVNLM